MDRQAGNQTTNKIESISRFPNVLWRVELIDFFCRIVRVPICYRKTSRLLRVYDWFACHSITWYWQSVFEMQRNWSMNRKACRHSTELISRSFDVFCFIIWVACWTLSSSAQQNSTKVSTSIDLRDNPHNLATYKIDLSHHVENTAKMRSYGESMKHFLVKRNFSSYFCCLLQSSFGHIVWHSLRGHLFEKNLIYDC